jgi:excisionase family DNA binding protein
VNEHLNHALTPKELAKRWRVRVTKVRDMIRRGDLAAIHFDGRQRVTPEAIAQAERGALAVRPRQRRRREKIDPEIAQLLDC